MNANHLQWRRTTPERSIDSNEIHVWRAYLDLNPIQIKSFLGILSSEEIERARRFRFERDQRRFIAAHGFLRKILSSYLGESPHKIQFENSGNGKPMLRIPPGDNTVHFNLSHSGAFALCAVARGKEIGVDIEHIRDDVAVNEIAQRFFSPCEISALETISQNTRNEVFFQYWTRKEAFMKATGAGISFPMEQCDVSLISGRVLSPITFAGDRMGDSCWYGQDLCPGRGYAAAIAVEGNNWDIQCWHYSA